MSKQLKVKTVFDQSIALLRELRALVRDVDRALKRDWVLALVVSCALTGSTPGGRGERTAESAGETARSVVAHKPKAKVRRTHKRLSGIEADRP
jgi:hypothetical protein